jgi:hypothetical protein
MLGLQKKKKNFYISCLSPLAYVNRAYLVKVFFLRIRQGSRPLLTIGWRNLHILCADIFDQ